MGQAKSHAARPVEPIDYLQNRNVFVPTTTLLADGLFRVSNDYTSVANRLRILVATNHKNTESVNLLLGESDCPQAFMGSSLDGYCVNAKWRCLMVGNIRLEVEQHMCFLDYDAVLKMQIKHCAGIIVVTSCDESTERTRDAPLKIRSTEEGKV
jgi:hypothetical protein